MPVAHHVKYPEKDIDISDENQDDESVDYRIGEAPASPGGTTSNVSGGIIKNLRTRKNINYNEDRLL